MPRKKKSTAKKGSDRIAVDEKEELVRAPHSFIIHRGLSCTYIRDLTQDFRHVMEPFTAMNLKEKKSNKIKDFVSLSGVFHVTHMCIFNKAKTQLSFKICRLPNGPTLTFKVHQFTLARDVINSSRKQFIDEELFHQAPLIIMNNFTGEGKHLKLMATTFQNMFPTINLATVNLANIKRCVLFSFNPNTNLVEMRHYAITVVPVGLSRGIKKVVLGKIPNLSRCDDIADFISSKTTALDSDMEDDETNQVVLPQMLKTKGNLENNKSAIHLHEIGPRFTIELIKIENGTFTGEVIYHELIVKSEQEIEELKKQREKKKKLKEKRRKIQDDNKLRKTKVEKNSTSNENIPDENDSNRIEPDNDAKYYEEEIGENPEEGLFKMHIPRKRVHNNERQNQRGSSKKYDGPDKKKFKSNDDRKFEQQGNKKFRPNNDKKFERSSSSQKKFQSYKEKKFERSDNKKFKSNKDKKFERPGKKKFNSNKDKKFERPGKKKFNSNKDKKFERPGKKKFKR